MNQNPIIPIIIKYLKSNYKPLLIHNETVCIAPDLYELPHNNSRSFGTIMRELRKIFSINDRTIYIAFDQYLKSYNKS